jgi:hypothetical protein
MTRQVQALKNGNNIFFILYGDKEPFFIYLLKLYLIVQTIFFF